MPRTPDMITGLFDNQVTQHREFWDNGVKGRHAHRRCIESDHPWREMRAPWLSYPDLPANAAKDAA